MNKLTKFVMMNILPSTIRKHIVRSKLPEFPSKIDGITFKQVHGDELDKCLKLVHDVYVDSGYIKPDKSGKRILDYHFSEGSSIFAAIDDKSGDIIYTASVFADSENGLPIDIAFEKEVDFLRNSGRKVVEIGCLASNPKYRFGNQFIPMLMNKTLFDYIYNVMSVNDIVITTHPKYSIVYEDILLFEKIGYIKTFSYVKGNPAVAYRCDINLSFQKYILTYGSTGNIFKLFFG